MTLKKISLALGATAAIALASSATAGSLEINIAGAPDLKGHTYVKCDPGYPEAQGIVNTAIPWSGVFLKFITHTIPAPVQTSTCTFYYGDNPSASTVIGSGEIHILSENDATLDNVTSVAPYTVSSSDTTGKHDYIAVVTQKS